MISLLYEKDPEKHYTGLDITPRMIEVGKSKNLDGVDWIVGDCENLPFEENTFDVKTPEELIAVERGSYSP